MQAKYYSKGVLIMARAHRRSIEEQLQLIAECRASDLTNAEWCRREGIRPDTYYTWIERLQARGLLEKAASVPQRVVRDPYVPDIVKVEVNQPTNTNPLQQQVALPTPSTAIDSEAKFICQNKAVMEISIGGITIKVTNLANPRLLTEALRAIGGALE
jgi:transposase-like protein